MSITESLTDYSGDQTDCVDDELVSFSQPVVPHNNEKDDTIKGPENVQGSPIKGDEQSGKPPRQCPYYKKIVKTSFAVDAFNYGDIPGVKYYFLSHFHYDHYVGLKKTFNGNLICSPITGSLVLSQIGVDPKYVTIIAQDQPTVIDGVKLVLLDANHCPGSIMFLFVLPDGSRILHTGDFRASPEMESISYLTESLLLDHMYLDTTYCNPDYNFPTQAETLQAIVDITLEHLQKDSKLLIVCGSYTIGKEKVFKTICSSLFMNLWVSPSKLKLFQCINDPVIDKYLVEDKNEAQVHVLPMRDVNHELLSGYLKGSDNRFTSIVAFKPTGWTENGAVLTDITPSIRGNVSIYGIPYSEHSSFREMERFVKFFKPKMITPTVFHSNPASRVLMFKSIAAWKLSHSSSCLSTS